MVTQVCLLVLSKALKREDEFSVVFPSSCILFLMMMEGGGGVARRQQIVMAMEMLSGLTTDLKAN